MRERTRARAYAICAELNGVCTCAQREGGPCKAILDVMEAGGIKAEKARIARGMKDNGTGPQ